VRQARVWGGGGRAVLEALPLSRRTSNHRPAPLLHCTYRKSVLCARYTRYTVHGTHSTQDGLAQDGTRSASRRARTTSWRTAGWPGAQEPRKHEPVKTIVVSKSSPRRGQESKNTQQDHWIIGRRTRDQAARDKSEAKRTMVWLSR
jgi:hypothetical protein